MLTGTRPTARPAPPISLARHRDTLAHFSGRAGSTPSTAGSVACPAAGKQPGPMASLEALSEILGRAVVF